MARSVDLSVSGRTRQYLVAGFVSLVFVTTLLVALTAAIGVRPGIWGPGIAVAVWTTLTVTWVARAGDPDEGSAWDGIPGWQYEGRFVRSGGLSRDEQERALGEDRNEE